MYISPNLLLGEPKNDLYSDQTGINPDFRKAKYNNIQAFRIMHIISMNDGDMNAEGIPEEAKRIFNEGKLFKSVPNGEVLAVKLKQLCAAWQEIKENPQLSAAVSGMVSTFHTSWKKYSDASAIYTDRENFPMYFDVAEYLCDLLDDDGNLKVLDKNGNISQADLKKQQDYLNLALSWRAELNAQEQEYTKSKNSDQAE